ncbi:MAG: hypothetical protein AB7F91_13180 [Parvularculaceae bacterium]
MKIGVSGHRSRDGADWAWVRGAIDDIIAGADVTSGISCLAPGADRVFADAVLERGCDLIVMAPTFPAGNGQSSVKGGTDFLAAASDVRAVHGATPDDAYLAAGKAVVDASDFMIFVWDGRPSRGLGGTADIVAYARSHRKDGVILDPIARSKRDLNAF